MSAPSSGRAANERPADRTALKLRGYFGVGIERVSKPNNVGNLFRTAHAFGASFVFTVAVPYDGRYTKADTSEAPRHLPFYRFADPLSMQLPEDCEVVGIELVEDAVELPIFRHPLSAAYVLGGERTGLSPELLARCDHVVRIPAAFSLNVATAGAIVIYDRLATLGRFGERPLTAQTPAASPPAHIHGGPRRRNRRPVG